MEKVFDNVSLEEMPGVAEQIVELASDYDIWTFEGNLGAGKTTLIKSLCRIKGIDQAIQSPTFSIVNVYETEDGETINHFDCYRLKTDEEAYDFGIEEYLDSGNLCFIESPQVIEGLLPRPYICIEIMPGENANSRKITLKTIE